MKFLSFFQDDTGAMSMMRLTLFLVTAWIVGTATFVTIYTGHLPEIPAGYDVIFGMVISGKAYQSAQEAKAS